MSQMPPNVFSNTYPVSKDFGQPYYDSLVARFQVLESAPGPESAKNLIRSIATPQKTCVTWSELFAVELAMMQLYPEGELTDQINRMRLDYRHLAGAELYALYESTQQKSDGCESPPQRRIRLEGEANFLLGAIQRLRYGSIGFEAIRSKVKKILIFGLFPLIVLGLVAYGVAAIFLNGKSDLTDFGWVALTGGFGAFFSVLQRIQTMEATGEMAIGLSTIASFRKRAIWAPFLSIVEGMVAAMVLQVLFVSKLLQGHLFPAYDDLTDGFRGFLLAHPNTGTGVAILAFWSFLAGFAERFVPDVLTQFTQAGTAAASHVTTTHTAVNAVTPSAPASPPQVDPLADAATRDSLVASLKNVTPAFTLEGRTFSITDAAIQKGASGKFDTLSISLSSGGDVMKELAKADVDQQLRRLVENAAKDAAGKPDAIASILIRNQQQLEGIT